MEGFQFHTLQFHFPGHEEVGGGREIATVFGPGKMLPLPCETLSLSELLQRWNRLKPSKEFLLNSKSTERERGG